MMAQIPGFVAPAVVGSLTPNVSLELQKMMYCMEHCDKNTLLLSSMDLFQ